MANTDDIISQFLAVGRKIKCQIMGAAPNLTLPQLETLRFIHEHQPAPMKDLADFLAVTPPSVTVAINTMVKTGLIERKYDAKNRRVIYLHLTPKGLALLKKAIRRRDAAFQSLLKFLSKPEQLTLLRLLNKLAAEK